MNCNVWKVQFDKVAINPASFRFNRGYRKTHANVGLGLYRRLLQNAQERSDSEYAAIADAHRRRWLRGQYRWERKQGHISRKNFLSRYVGNLIFDWLACYGYSPTRFFIVSLGVLFVLTMPLHYAWDAFGLARNGQAIPQGDFSQTFFYTAIIASTLGFTDIYPITYLGRLYTLALAFLGVGWAGLFTAILVRRVLR